MYVIFSCDDIHCAWANTNQSTVAHGATRKTGASRNAASHTAFARITELNYLASFVGMVVKHWKKFPELVYWGVQNEHLALPFAVYFHETSYS
jgi:hypothetical protein